MLSSFVKSVLRSTPRGYDLVKALGRFCGRKSEIYSGLKSRIDPLGAFSFLQIGAHDGLASDPYREFMILNLAKGVAVEPVPEYFSRLIANYRGYPQVECLNAAITYGDEEANFYSFTAEYLNSIASAEQMAGLAGFSKEKLVSALPANVDPNTSIKEVPVKTCSVERILDERNMASFDCIFMDCEGHELNILQGMDFSRVKPRLIAYEHTHYAQDQSPLDELLQSKGFKIQKFQYDAVAVRLE